jgi:hypothetical protein
MSASFLDGSMCTGNETAKGMPEGEEDGGGAGGRWPTI